MTTAPSPRSRIKRQADRADYAAAAVIAILEEGIIAHVGVVGDDGAPVVIPMGYAVDGTSILVHGSAASRLMRAYSTVCVTVTILDGLVVARSLFESSMNYRSVVAFGVPDVLSGDEKRLALDILSNRLLPGRVGHAREPSEKEIRATTVWRISLDEASAKIRVGPPVDDAEDLDLPYWGGVIPLRTSAGSPVGDQLGRPIETPDHIDAIVARFNK